VKDLSLNVLDVTHNSITAGAKQIDLSIEETADTLRICIRDDGCGMDEKLLASVTDPFTTTRTTRRVGMGIPLFKLAAEQTGGSLEIKSTVNVGTEVTAVFHRDHIDCPPLGDMAATVAMLMAAVPEESNLTYRFETEKGGFSLGTAELREILGEGIPLGEPEVQQWIAEHIREQELSYTC
jgi:hypothetical protein